MSFFQKIVKAVRSVFSKSKIEAELGVRIAVSSKMEERIELWTEMFEDRPPWKDPESGKKTLNLPVSISTEIARLVTLEMKSTVSGSPRADYVNTQYQRAVDKARNYTEFAAGTGGIVLKPFVAGKNIYTTTVQAEDFWPTEFDSDGEVRGAVFRDFEYDEKYRYTRLEWHTYDNGLYVIRNKCYRLQISDITPNSDNLGDPVPLTSVARWADVGEEVRFGNVDKPLFAYYKMPFANNVESKSPLGVSAFARAVSQIQEADRLWSEIVWEYKSKEAALHASDNLFERDSQGKVILPEGEERLYRTFRWERDQKLDTFSPEIRDTSMFNGLNKYLQKIEFQCGLAYGTLSEPSMVDKTAEEIIQSKQRSYATVLDTQKALEKALRHLVYAIDTLTTLYGLAPAGNYDVTFELDDSVVVDAERERQRDLQEVREGLMKKWEFRVKWYGETPEKAKQMVGAEEDESDEEILDFITNEPEEDEGAQKPEVNGG
jgi:A118 family predicted phage portal protein